MIAKMTNTRPSRYPAYLLLVALSVCGIAGACARESADGGEVAPDEGQGAPAMPMKRLSEEVSKGLMNELGAKPRIVIVLDEMNGYTLFAPAETGRSEADKDHSYADRKVTDAAIKEFDGTLGIVITKQNPFCVFDTYGRRGCL